MIVSSTSAKVRWGRAMCWILHLFGIIICSVKGDLRADFEGLVTFKDAVDVAKVLERSWQGNDPCGLNWTGVACYKGRVWNLILEGKQLRGSIPDQSLSRLDKLRKISLQNNSLSGDFPTLTSNFLRAVWLNSNEFQGPIPDIFLQTVRLNVLDLANNQLNGSIPISLATVPNLRELRLQNNSLNGSIPSFNQDSLRDFNVSYNALSGEIPKSMQTRFGASAFANNAGLCGAPLNASCVLSPPPAAPPSPPSKAGGGGVFGSRATEIMGIVGGDVVVLLLITLVFFWYYRKRARKREREEKGNVLVGGGGAAAGRASEAEEERKETSSSAPTTESESLGASIDIEASKLVLVSHEAGEFELEDLLRASAELLGRGSAGISYRAIMERDTTVVVKRLGKNFISCKQKEFEQQTQLLGRLHHPNLVPLLAYFFSKDEKLLVSAFMPNSSLFSLLHGNRGGSRTSLDWTFRLKVALSVSRGLAFLHRECRSQKIPHGNIKSTNVLFDKNNDARVADFGLAPLLTNSSAANFMIAFKAPEYISSDRLTRKTDVYSFGVLLLELLTGKLPSYYNRNGDPTTDELDLPEYVRSMTEAGRTIELFDMDLEDAISDSAEQEEMVILLKLAMECTSFSPEQRPKMSEVLKRIEKIRKPEHFQTQGENAPN